MYTVYAWHVSVEIMNDNDGNRIVDIWLKGKNKTAFKTNGNDKSTAAERVIGIGNTVREHRTFGRILFKHT